MNCHTAVRLVFCACLLGLLPHPAASAVQTATSGHADRATVIDHCRDKAQITKGVCVILGCRDGHELLPLVESEDFFVHVLDPRPEAVAAAQKTLSAGELYGRRVVCERSEFSRLPYADRMIDLVLSVDLTSDQLKQLDPQEIIRVLRPGGKAILGQRESADKSAKLTADQLRAWLRKAQVDGAEIARDDTGIWALLTGPPQAGVDSWSHWEHGPDNNPVSTDTVIKAPYMTQWLGEPLYITMPAITTSAGGRLFLAMGHIAHHRREEPWLQTLLARNAYNGSILWTRKLPSDYLVHRSAFIATAGTFYMISDDGSGCLLLDPQTGLEKRRIAIPEIAQDQWKWMALKDGILYVLAGKMRDTLETTVVRSKFTHWSWGELSAGYYAKRVPWGFGTTILAYDLSAGKTIWSHGESKAIDSRAMVVGGHRVFFYGPDSRIGCLDASSGRLIWANDSPKVGELIEQPGQGLTSTPGFRSACFSLYTPKALLFEAQTRMNIVAVSPQDGKLLWHRKKTTNNPNMIYADDLLYVGAGPNGNTLAVDPSSGEVIKDLGFKKRSCARLTATPDSFFCRGWPEGLTRFDRQSGQVLFNGAFRPSCNDGVVPANGLLYLGPWPCDCNLSVMGRVALTSANDQRPDPQWADFRRLEIGTGDPAKVRPLEVTAADWPTYRANVARTGSSAAAVAARVQPAWQYQAPALNRPTAPTAAGDLVFLGGDDGKVIAIDATNGTLKWSLLTAGRISQPPTISGGRAYVGSGDGYVYALEAATGRLLWRYRVAPVDRRIMAYGRLSSTWPVNSGVLVQDGVAYAAAGIVDYDNTYVCALDAMTGQVKWSNDQTGHLDPALRKGVSAQGILTVANGRLWMAGGNVISPAAFDLDSGRYLSGLPGDGSPRSNRGEEVAVFKDHFIVQGGRLRFSAVRNVVNPGNFSARGIGQNNKLGRPMLLCAGKIAPAWDAQSVALVLGAGMPPVCVSVDAVEQYLQKGDPKSPPAPKWTCAALRGSDTVSVVLARNAVLAVCSSSRPRNRNVNWRLVVLNRDTGQLMSQHNLPSEAVPGGLLVDRRGRIVVVLQDGTVSCFRGPNA